MMPAIVVPVFISVGGSMPFFSMISLRLHRSNENPPAFDPIAGKGPLAGASLSGQEMLYGAYSCEASKKIEP